MGPVDAGRWRYLSDDFRVVAADFQRLFRQLQTSATVKLRVIGPAEADDSGMAGRGHGRGDAEIRIEVDGPVKQVDGLGFSFRRNPRNSGKARR